MKLGVTEKLLEIGGIDLLRKCLNESSAYDTHVDENLNFIQVRTDGVYTEDLDGKMVKIEPELRNFASLTLIRTIVESFDTIQGNVPAINSEEHSFCEMVYEDQGLEKYAK
jgi:hypothetical protein